MAVVSFRIPDEDETLLKRAGIRPGPLAKRLVEAEAARLRVEDHLATLDRMGKPADRPVDDLVREARDEH